MTEIFKSNLSIIILALIAGVRLVLYLRKRVAQKAENRMPPPLDGIEAIEAEGAALALDEDAGDFSAWNLSVEPRKPNPPPVWNPGTSPPVSNVAPLPIPDERTNIPGMGLPPKTIGSFWKKLRGLPPLRQSVILSEILGPPKGFF